MPAYPFPETIVRPEIGTELRRAKALSSEHLMRIAVLRGCRHYRPLLSSIPSTDEDNGMLHEVLGVALLRGPQDVATFQAIRCGAMVLSDLGNDPSIICPAAEYFGVTDRVAHIAKLGLTSDTCPAYWERLLDLLPDNTSDDSFLPGLSRLTSETRVSPLTRRPVCTWLRTAWSR